MNLTTKQLRQIIKEELRLLESEMISFGKKGPKVLQYRGEYETKKFTLENERVLEFEKAFKKLEGEQPQVAQIIYEYMNAISNHEHVPWLENLIKQTNEIGKARKAKKMGGGLLYGDFQEEGKAMIGARDFIGKFLKKRPKEAGKYFDIDMDYPHSSAITEYVFVNEYREKLEELFYDWETFRQLEDEEGFVDDEIALDIIRARTAEQLDKPEEDLELDDIYYDDARDFVSTLVQDWGFISGISMLLPAHIYEFVGVREEMYNHLEDAGYETEQSLLDEMFSSHQEIMDNIAQARGHESMSHAMDSNRESDEERQLTHEIGYIKKDIQNPNDPEAVTRALFRWANITNDKLEALKRLSPSLQNDFKQVEEFLKRTLPVELMELALEGPDTEYYQLGTDPVGEYYDDISQKVSDLLNSGKQQ